MMLLLAWVASCDGEISSEELEALRSIATSGSAELDLTAVIEVTRSGEVADLQLACEILQETESKTRPLLLQLAVGMALEDGHITTAEGHIVRFIADVLSQTPFELDRLFREMTGEAFPSASDPSSIDWWESRESRNRKQTTQDAEEPRARTSATPPSNSSEMKRLRALATLGLDEAATIQDVRQAYLRMAKVHHPDRFVTIGPEAVRAAETSFRRIQEAYESLGGQ